jgi:hypothetical protein
VSCLRHQADSSQQLCRGHGTLSVLQYGYPGSACGAGPATAIFRTRHSAGRRSTNFTASQLWCAALASSCLRATSPASAIRRIRRSAGRRSTNFTASQLWCAALASSCLRAAGPVSTSEPAASPSLYDSGSFCLSNTCRSVSSPAGATDRCAGPTRASLSITCPTGSRCRTARTTNFSATGTGLCDILASDSQPPTCASPRASKSSCRASSCRASSCDPFIDEWSADARSPACRSPGSRIVSLTSCSPSRAAAIAESLESWRRLHQADA